MSDDRAKRLSRNRRTKSAETSDADEQSEQSQPSEPSEPSEGDERSEPPVKEVYDGVYMYVPGEMKAEIEDRYQELAFRYDGTLEKNRHFYPLLARYGLESLEGLESSEIQERLDRVLGDV